VKRQNTRFTLGPRKFEVLDFPPGIPGQGGLLPVPAIIDPTVGEEIALYWADPTPFIHELAAVRPFQLFMRSGLFRSEHGPLMWLLFFVPNPQPEPQPYAMMECHINPSEPRQVATWRRLANQSHWHLTLMGAGSEVFGFYEFENTFALDDALDMMEQACRDMNVTDFLAAKQEFWGTFTLEELFEMA
jgi:hypothetical protein